MSQKRGTNEVSFRNSGATIPAYRIVTPSGNNTVALWNTQTAYMLGLSQEQSGDSGTAILVAIGGTAKGQAGASVSAGALLTGLTATGEVIEAAANILNTTTTVIPRSIGLSLQTGDSGAAIEVLVSPGHVRIAFA